MATSFALGPSGMSVTGDETMLAVHAGASMFSTSLVPREGRSLAACSYGKADWLYKENVSYLAQ